MTILNKIKSKTNMNNKAYFEGLILSFNNAWTNAK